jgi:hypothetical protein
MAKTRLTIPKVIRDAVLKEFNHRCAICGTDRPQVHHIDEDPSNNDLLNLIPLCPNCHLVDQHNPTIPMDAEKLRLFREFKDPAILKPQFHPLFIRIKYLSSITDDDDISDLKNRSQELIDFVAALEMGTFYSKKIDSLLHVARFWDVSGGDDSAQYRAAQHEKRARLYREKLRNAKDEVYSLIVELLRFQKW